jgi:tetratricopeptide (TPR) repeat protein
MESFRRGHAQYFGSIVINQVAFGLYSANALHWLNWIESEHGNIRATLAWGLSSAQDIEFMAGLIFALAWFWYRRGYCIEGYTWAEKVLASQPAQLDSPLRGIALQASGMLALWQGKQDTALARLQESLAIMQRFEDDLMMALLHMANAIAFINMGRDGSAQPLLEQAQVVFKEKKQLYFFVITIVHLGNAELGLGHPEQARVKHEEALAIARSIGESWLLTFALNNLGEVARTQGRYDPARAYYEECEMLLRDTGDRGDLARFVHSLGYIAQHEEEYELAESQFRKSLKMFRRLGNRRGIAECLAGLAGLRARQGDPRWGAIMLSAGESLLFSTGGAWWPADRIEVERNREIIQTALTEDEFTIAWKKGGAMTIDQAIGFASDES